MSAEAGAIELDSRIEDNLQAIQADQWDRCAGPHPLVQHAFLSSLERAGVATAERGAVIKPLVFRDPEGRIVACAPGLLKWNTWREHGPEHHWLRQGLADGSFAWPKFQVGVPFMATAGPRLLVHPQWPQAVLRSALLASVQRLGRRLSPSGVVNLMHLDAYTARQCEAAGALLSGELHAVWLNRGYPNVQTYLETLPRHKRYDLRHNQRQACSHGLTYRVLTPADISQQHLADYEDGHHRVCERYGTRPWLPPGTFAHWVAALGPAVRLAGYFDRDRLIAGILQVASPQEGTLYLLQWSERAKLPGVALDLLCLRPVEQAIEEGWQRIDSGLAAQHKTLRGWTVVAVHNAHWFGNDTLRRHALTTLGIPRPRDTG